MKGNERKWRPKRPKRKETKAQKAKMKGNEGPKGKAKNPKMIGGPGLLNPILKFLGIGPFFATCGGGPTDQLLFGIPGLNFTIKNPFFKKLLIVWLVTFKGSPSWVRSFSSTLGFFRVCFFFGLIDLSNPESPPLQPCHPPQTPVQKTWIRHGIRIAEALRYHVNHHRTFQKKGLQSWQVNLPSLTYPQKNETLIRGY